MTTLTLDLPAEVFSALRRSPEEFGRELGPPPHDGAAYALTIRKGSPCAGSSSVKAWIS